MMQTPPPQRRVSRNLDFPTSCWRRSSRPSTSYHHPSRPASFLARWLASTCSARPAPAPAKRPPSPSRSWNGSNSSKKGAPPQAIILVPTRELAVQVREEVEKLAHGRRVTLRARLRRQTDPRTDRQTPARRRRRRRHARPRARSHRPQRPRLAHCPLRRARRSRPHARHRLPPRHRKNSPPLPQRTPDAALQRHGRAAASNASPESTCAIRRSLDFSPKNVTVDTIDQFYFTVDHERKFDLLLQLLKREKPRAGDRLLPHQARHRSRVPQTQQTASKGVDSHPRRHDANGARPGDEELPRRRGQAFSWPPTSSAAASTSPASRTSSITTFRSPPTTTSTASAAPAAWAAKASPTRSSRTEEGGELTRIEMLINRLLKRDEIEGFSSVASPATKAPAAAKDGAVTSTGKDTERVADEPQPEALSHAARQTSAEARHRRGL